MTREFYIEMLKELQRKYDFSIDDILLKLENEILTEKEMSIAILEVVKREGAILTDKRKKNDELGK